MNDNQRFSILTFPQFFDGGALSLRIVVLPRDQNPLSAAIQQHPTIPDAPPFAQAQLSFTANIFDSLAVFPHNHPPVAALPLATNAPDNPAELFEALANHFTITNLNTTNRNIDLLNMPADEQPEAPRKLSDTVWKNLPRSYQKAFNFTRPRTPNAVTDDSYQCAVKDARPVPGFQRSPDAVSWGKVFAYLMRQPFLATRAGMIYDTSLEIDPAHFPNGGWLYVDLSADSDYHAQQETDFNFIRRYAARIPALDPDAPRQVFAPVLFPVLFKAQAADPDPAPSGDYTDLFIEAAEFDDGFAKIVHCRQPPNRDLLLEENDGAHPVKDVGIQLGWDDEQLLIWHIRQLLDDPAGGLSGRLEAPLGVFGYLIDVREAAEPENQWESLNLVSSRQPLQLPRTPGDPNDAILLGSFTGTLPYQVYPSQLDGQEDGRYWLPMYFASWNGHSMVLPDPEAALIYQTTNVDVTADPEDPVNDTGTGVSGPAANQLNQMYQPGEINTGLRYGRNYEFRIRLQDLSGGAPPLAQGPVNETASDIAACRFKRYVSPLQPRILELQPFGNDSDVIANSDTPSAIPELNIRRPKLGYPAVVYTGKYTDPVQRLIDQAQQGIAPEADPEHRVGLGIADPDVDRIEIGVEIASLKLDKLDSISGKEDYVHLYTTYRRFPEINGDDDYENVLNIPIEYKDVADGVLHSGAETDVVNDLNLEAGIDELDRLVLPTGRTARLTIRAVAEEKNEPAHGTTTEEYYGFVNDGEKQLDNRYGETFEITVYTPSTDETGLLIQTAGVPRIQGIFMPPDVVDAFDGKFTTLLFGKQNTVQQNNVQQLADRLELGSIGLTLAAPKGQRVVFGCSSRIRHTLSPDNSSLTFASKGDLINHWLCCISLEIDRDWMWDALETRAFVIRRTKKYQHDEAAESTDALIGDVEIMRTASFEALHDPQRNTTRIVFLDVVEPKKEPAEGADEPGFPDAIEVSYSIETRFKQGHGEQHDDPEPLELLLPVTTPPSQVPKIISAGIALSPYERNEDYSATETRKRHLWIEFAEPVKDPQDVYFARLLAVAPDQLISNNNPGLLAAPEEPALPIDPEPIRVVTPGATNELAGLNAMQPMEKSTSSDRHYLMPLPPGLHAAADELFGFFTYEFRLGHFRRDDTGEMVWTTAQGRFGRRLRATGIQHPPPALTCMPNRDEKKLWVTAPYAVAVDDGKNVTADPPRTGLWALLYAQVKQADNRDYRNILLDDRPLDWRVQVKPEPEPGVGPAGDLNVLTQYTEQELEVLQSIAVKNFSYELNVAKITDMIQLVDFSTKNKDATRYGTAVWTNGEVRQLLTALGLPRDSPLSVIVVETLPQITNIFDHVSGLDKPKVAQVAENLVAEEQKGQFRHALKRRNTQNLQRVVFEMPSPVSDELGRHRLLRTSPLTPVPEVCCEEC